MEGQANHGTACVFWATCSRNSWSYHGVIFCVGAIESTDHDLKLITYMVFTCRIVKVLPKQPEMQELVSIVCSNDLFIKKRVSFLFTKSHEIYKSTLVLELSCCLILCKLWGAKPTTMLGHCCFGFVLCTLEVEWREWGGHLQKIHHSGVSCLRMSFRRKFPPGCPWLSLLPLAWLTFGQLFAENLLAPNISRLTQLHSIHFCSENPQPRIYDLCCVI